MNLIRKLWATVPVPRPITAATTIVYTLIAGMGVEALTNPPRSIDNELGGTLTTIWGWFLLGGGTLAALACPFGRWWAEKLALWLIVPGLGIYTGTVFSLHLMQDGNRLVQFYALTALTLLLVSRYLRIHRYSYEPGK